MVKGFSQGDDLISLDNIKEKWPIYAGFGAAIMLVIIILAMVGVNVMGGDPALSLAAFTNPTFITIVLVAPIAAVAIVVSGFLLVDEKSKTVEQFYSNRWMTKSEANREYIYSTLSGIGRQKKTGTLVRFEASGRDIHINMVPKDYHTIVLGTTGSGKGQTFVNPFIYTLGHSGAKPNMVVTDPKGELYNMMAETLRRNGYDVQVFNLSEPTKSSTWNPFERAWNMFQRAHGLDKELIKHSGVNPNDMGLRIIAQNYPNEWYEFNKVAFPSFDMADMERKTLKQRLLSESEADIKDICAVICPIENEKDPSWEQGARDMIQGTALAMLEDSLRPELGMTKERFNFYNVFKILTLRDNDPNNSFGSIRNYFEGRSKLSPASMLAQTVVANSENTMRNFFGVVTNKLSMFADKGICYITSGTEIMFEGFVDKPTVLFLIIPDQIKIRHPLATLMVAQLYKALVESANNMGGTLKWPTYFILDEFGNMPKINDFSTIITVARSRGLFFTLILQDYKQLEAVYGPESAVTIRNNCNTQIFIGVNDMDTRKMFSDLMGEMAIETETESISKTTGKAAENDSEAGSKSINKNKVSRPLLPPNELLDLKMGSLYVYCFGFNPLRTTVTPWYQCVKNGLVTLYKAPEEWQASKYFDEENIYYDIRRRNDIVIKNAKRNDVFDW
ncbi:MAG: type IV secretory system conjugative DNA transfer family protein [Firmicutes bacterium]|nr:type IV secretory system conjugative DNA transfer family protein [Bacillota bacterium]